MLSESLLSRATQTVRKNVIFLALVKKTKMKMYFFLILIGVNLAAQSLISMTCFLQNIHLLVVSLASFFPTHLKFSYLLSAMHSEVILLIFCSLVQQMPLIAAF